MAQSTGFGRGVSTQDSQPSTSDGRRIKGATADNVQVAPMAHSTASGLDKAATATRAVPSTAGTVRRVDQPKPAVRPIMRALK